MIDSIGGYEIPSRMALGRSQALVKGPVSGEGINNRSGSIAQWPFTVDFRIRCTTQMRHK
jgi:hypothetical protein